jgi:hypothetical protein
MTEGDTMRGAWRRRMPAGLAVLLLGGAGTAAGSTAAVAGSTAAVAGTTAGGALPTGQVYLVHGILGTPVDVDVDGRRLAAAARPKTVLGPLTLTAGRHVVVLHVGTRTVTSASFLVPAGRSIDVVAARAANAAQSPRVVVFRNDLDPVGRGKTRLVVAHAAVAPPADVRLDGSVLFRDVSSGESLSLLVPAKSYTVDAVPVAGAGTVLDPVELSLKAGTLTRVFAVGDPAAGTADAVVQVLKVAVEGSGVPRSVPTGDGGQAADVLVGPAAGPPWAAVAAGLLLFGLASRLALHLRTRVRERRGG